MSANQILVHCASLVAKASSVLEKQGVPLPMQNHCWEVDCRFRGQATNIPVTFHSDEIRIGGTAILEERFKQAHTKLFTFSLELPVELVTIRVVAEENVKDIAFTTLQRGTGKPMEGSVAGATTIVRGF